MDVVAKLEDLERLGELEAERRRREGPSPGPEPHSEESERAVLAALLESPGLLPQVADRLSPEDFYLERHQAAYRTLLELRGLPADAGRLDAHVEVVKERAVRRRLIRTAHDVRAAALAGGRNAADALREAEAIAEELKAGRPPQAHNPGA